MEKSEFESLLKQLKAAGLNDEQIMETFYETFQEGKMDRKDLESCAEFLGYELTDEFKQDGTPDPIAKPEGGITEEQAEAAKEIAPGESQEEFRESIEGAGEGDEPKPEPEKPSEDEEWKEVQKKFKW